MEGAANAAVLAAVADAFGLRRAGVALVSGARGRDKVLDLDGDETVLRARLDALLGVAARRPAAHARRAATRAGAAA